MTANAVVSLCKDVKEAVHILLQHRLGACFPRRIATTDVEKLLAPALIDICSYSGDLPCRRVELKSTVTCFVCRIMELLGKSLEEQTYVQRMSFDELLKYLEDTFDLFIKLLGGRLGLSLAQEAALEADLAAIIDTITALEHHTVEAQSGCERLMRSLVRLLQDLGAAPALPRDDTLTAVDVLLQELLRLADVLLDVCGPDFNLDSYSIGQLKRDLCVLKVHMQDVQHGRVPLSEGLVQCVDDVFNTLRQAGVPVLSQGDCAESLGERCRRLTAHVTQLVERSCEITSSSST